MKNKERQAKYRNDREKEGLVRKEFWIKLEWLKDIQELIKQLKDK